MADLEIGNIVRVIDGSHSRYLQRGEVITITNSNRAAIVQFGKRKSIVNLESIRKLESDENEDG